MLWQVLASQLLYFSASTQLSFFRTPDLFFAWMQVDFQLVLTCPKTRAFEARMSFRGLVVSACHRAFQAGRETSPVEENPSPPDIV